MRSIVKAVTQAIRQAEAEARRKAAAPLPLPKEVNGRDGPEPTRFHMEFYETDELGGQIDNWCGPTVECLMAMTRAGGFPRA